MPGSVTGAGKRTVNKTDNILAFVEVIFSWEK